MKHQYQIAVIGAGAGGLVIAIGAAKAGKKVLLIEKGHYGGDCTNFGCIPSKALIAAAEKAHAFRQAKSFGVKIEGRFLNGDDALERTRLIVQQIREEEEPEALAKMGLKTLTGSARFLDPNTLSVNESLITANQIVIATGSRPKIPPIRGLDQVPYLTNETLFSLSSIPKRLAVVGGGPIGCEMAQAFSRLGSQVTLIVKGDRLLPKEEPEASLIIKEAFEKEGIRILLNQTVMAATKENGQIALTLNQDENLTTDELLIATGREPATSALNLEAIGVETGKNGEISVDAYGRTSRKNIWAVGDCTDYAIFTHIAENQARGVLTNLLIAPLRFKLDWRQAIPRCTFTDPEVAAVGLKEAEAVQLYGKKRLAIYTLPFSKLDRAVTASRTEGMIKVITKKWSGKILGATLVGERAGDMLSEISLAMREKIPLRKLAGLIHPYPVYSLCIRKVADQWLTKTIIPFFK